jgi:simple sugar transport system substrate-binding protein/ribose transport system substrate-binding protein
MSGHRPQEVPVRVRRSASLFAACLTLAALTAAGCSSKAPGATSTSAATGSGPIKIGVALTYNDTAFWAAYIGYEKTYAGQDNVQLIGPELAQADAALQNQQIETLVNEGAKAIIVNPETATSLGPAIAYAAARGVQLVSVDTIVGTGHVYMVVRASNTLYGEDACTYISSKVKSGDVLDLEGDLTSSNGSDRTDAFDTCMQANDPGVTLLKDPTVWTESTAVTDAQNALNAYGSKLKAIYSQWSSPDTGVLPLLSSHGYGKVGSANHIIVVSDDGVAFEMCDIQQGTLDASQSQPANLYAQYALQYAVDAAKGVTLSAGQPGGGAPTLQNVSYNGDTNLADPIVAPFVTSTAESLSVNTPADSLPASLTTTPVTDQSLWGNVYGAAHGGVCSSSASS